MLFLQIQDILSLCHQSADRPVCVRHAGMRQLIHRKETNTYDDKSSAQIEIIVLETFEIHPEIHMTQANSNKGLYHIFFEGYSVYSSSPKM